MSIPVCVYVCVCVCTFSQWSLLHHVTIYLLYYCTFYICIVVEGKRSSGKAAVWVSRDRFAVLDKANQVHVYVLYSVYFKCSCVHMCV